MTEKRWEQKRNKVKKILTRNLGKVIEEEDKLICYVEKSKLKMTRYICDISCCGIMLKDKNLADYYKLNKPIVYILDGIEVKNKNIHIHGHRNCEVIIKNCKFNYQLNIFIDGNCTLENTTIDTIFPIIIGSDNLLIKNMDITNQYKYSKQQLPIYIRGINKLEINNSTIGDYTTITNISSKNTLEVSNSTISGEKVTCKADKVIFGKNSKIQAKEKTNLEIKDFNEINITSPIILTTRNNYFTNNKPIILRQTLDTLKLKRVELIKYLQDLKTKVELIKYLQDLKTKVKNENNILIEEYQSKLNNKPIVKVLSKEFTNN